MSIDVNYETSATAIGGRDGRTHTEDGKIDLQLSVPNPADATVTATVGIGICPEGGFGITAELGIRLPNLDHAQAQQVVGLAHQICPYSNATRNNVAVRVNLL